MLTKGNVKQALFCLHCSYVFTPALDEFVPRFLRSLLMLIAFSHLREHSNERNVGGGHVHPVSDNPTVALELQRKVRIVLQIRIRNTGTRHVT